MKISTKTILPILIILHTFFWYIAFYFLSLNDIFGLYTNFWDFILSKQGEFYSTILMTMITFNIILSCRFSIFEKIFSGLDKVYVVHKYIGYFIVLLIILHNSLIHESRIHLTGFFTFAKDVTGPLFWLFLIVIFISALPHIPVVNKILKIPYHIWKYTHYLMGILFLVGIYHSVGVTTLTFSNTTLSIYMYFVYIVGTLCLVYKTFLYNYFKNKYQYIVSDIKNFEEAKTLEINMIPKDTSRFIKNKAGQFAFFQFLEEEIKEIHPFTISNYRNENGILRVSIKALGDWTSHLKDKLKVGTKVLIDGPYGYFVSRKKGDDLEIWIAGGIGITPFLAILENYKKQNNQNKKIIFVWSVKDESEAIYKNEIENNIPNNIEFILHDTSKMRFFSFLTLESKLKKELKNNISVFICGPEPMRKAIIKDAKEMGIKNFNFEQFNFR